VPEGHPVHTTGPQHQHAVPERAGKVAETTARYDQTVKCMANRKFYLCMLYRALQQTLANVQMRKRLDTYANLVHGFSMPGLKTRHDNIDIVVIR
jgi:isocitrate/isopropylmalate dehydrogenase